MKAVALLLCLSGLVMTGLAVTPGSDVPEEVVTFGPLEPPFPTPRVRVSNDRADSVDLWWVRGADSTSATKLGEVSAHATRTFLLPPRAGPDA